MKKIIALILVVVCALCVFAGCEKTETDENGNVITVKGDKTTVEIASLPFEFEYDGMQITWMSTEFVKEFSAGYYTPKTISTFYVKDAVDNDINGMIESIRHQQEEDRGIKIVGGAEDGDGTYHWDIRTRCEMVSADNPGDALLVVTTSMYKEVKEDTTGGVYIYITNDDGTKTTYLLDNLELSNNE